MRNASVFNFMNLQDPVAALALEFGFREGSPTFEAVNLVWDFCQDRCITRKGGYNLPAAYNATKDHIKECTRLFAQYEADYNLTAKEHDIALAAMLTPKAVDPWGKECWDMMGDDVAFVLTIMDLQENKFMLPSEAEKDRVLAINVGLKALLELNDTLDTYTKRHNPNTVEPDADLHFAFRVLNDRPTLETALTRDCQTQAKQVIDLLKGRTTFHRPVLAFERKPTQS